MYWIIFFGGGNQPLKGVLLGSTDESDLIETDRESTMEDVEGKCTAAELGLRLIVAG